MDINSNLNFMNSLLSNPKNQLIFGLLSLWGLAWKGFALWKSSKNDQKNWFIILLITNTFGILEIIYIFYFQAREKKENIVLK